jgi:hypothetical protein
MLSGKLTDGSIAFSSLPPAFSLGNFTYIFLIVSRGKRGDARRAAVLTIAARPKSVLLTPVAQLAH